MPFEFLGRDGDLTFWEIPPELGPHKILAAVGAGHAIAQAFRARCGDSRLVTRFVQAAGQARILVNYAGTLYVRWGDQWAELDSPATTSRWLEDTAVWVLHQYGGLNPDEWSCWGKNDWDGGALEALEGAEGSSEISEVLRDAPVRIAQSLGTAGHWPRLPRCQGIAHHPYYGASEAGMTWLPVYQDPPAVQEPGYPHLRKLFDQFTLKPGDPAHVALHVFLLSSFHEVSLSAARPILMVDSWSRGRGKTEVCKALRTLIDDTDAGHPMRKTRENAFDESVATLLRGRMELIDNVEGVCEFFHTAAVSASTGTLEVRPKGARFSTKLHGRLFVLNSVLGSCSLSEDVLARLLRVELPGHAQALSHVPHEYARANRGALIAEILDVLEATAEEELELEQLSRFRAFYKPGIVAYARVFGLPVDTVREGLRGALESGKLYKKPVLGHCMKAMPDLFEEPYWPAGGFQNDRTAVLNGFAPNLQPDDAGATAFGRTLVQHGDTFSWQ